MLPHYFIVWYINDFILYLLYLATRYNCAAAKECARKTAGMYVNQPMNRRVLGVRCLIYVSIAQFSVVLFFFTVFVVELTTFVSVEFPFTRVVVVFFVVIV